MHAIVIIPVYQPETVLPIVWLILWPIFSFNLGWQLFVVVWILLLWYLIWLTFAAYLNIVIALHR